MTRLAVIPGVAVGLRSWHSTSILLQLQLSERVQWNIICFESMSQSEVKKHPLKHIFFPAEGKYFHKKQ